MSDEPRGIVENFLDDDEEEYDCEEDRGFSFWLWRYTLAMAAVGFIAAFFYCLEWHKNRHKRIVVESGDEDQERSKVPPPRPEPPFSVSTAYQTDLQTTATTADISSTMVSPHQLESEADRLIAQASEIQVQKSPSASKWFEREASPPDFDHGIATSVVDREKTPLLETQDIASQLFEIEASKPRSDQIHATPDFGRGCTQVLDTHNSGENTIEDTESNISALDEQVTVVTTINITNLAPSTNQPLSASLEQQDYSTVDLRVQAADNTQLPPEKSKLLQSALAEASPELTSTAQQVTLSDATASQVLGAEAESFQIVSSTDHLSGTEETWAVDGAIGQPATHISEYQVSQEFGGQPIKIEGLLTENPEENGFTNISDSDVSTAYNAQDVNAASGTETTSPPPVPPRTHKKLVEQAAETSSTVEMTASAQLSQTGKFLEVDGEPGTSVLTSQESGFLEASFSELQSSEQRLEELKSSPQPGLMVGSQSLRVRNKSSEPEGGGDVSSAEHTTSRHIVIGRRGSSASQTGEQKDNSQYSSSERLQKPPEASKILERSLRLSQDLSDSSQHMMSTSVTQFEQNGSVDESLDNAMNDLQEDITLKKRQEGWRKQTSHDSVESDAASALVSISQRGSVSHSSARDQDSIVSGGSSLLELLGVTDTGNALKHVTTLDEVSAIMREAGLEHSNLIFGIDYTASNKYQGDDTFDGHSLHSIRKGILNPYQQVIMVVGKTLMPFASSGFIPAFGFGDASTTDWSVFPLKEKGYPKAFDEVLKVYTKITPKVILSGPTNFAPLIHRSIDICKQFKEYHILVIVADGQVTNERATRRAIVDACNYPLSIIVIGVGDGPWDQMRVFDESLPKRPWDNFHFLEFHKTVSGKKNQDVAFALESLMEIPDQYKLIKKLGLLGN